MIIETNYNEEMIGERLDYALADYFEDISRSKMAKAIQAASILVNGLPAKASYALKAGDKIEVDLGYFEPIPLEAEDIPLEVLYEDEDILVVNKPAGLIVHPTPSLRQGTLVNALLALSVPLSSVNGEDRPGIVHRLDADTSGAIIIAKNDESHLNLQNQFQNRLVKKLYYAVLEDHIGSDLVQVEQPIGRDPHNRKLMTVRDDGKYSQSIFRKVKATDKASFCEVEILTGRTHQIRVHAAYLKHPVVGDRLYGYKKQKFKTERQLLHAHELRFNHPKTGKEINILATLPEDFQAFLDKHQLN